MTLDPDSSYFSFLDITKGSRDHISASREIAADLRRLSEKRLVSA